MLSKLAASCQKSIAFCRVLRMNIYPVSLVRSQSVSEWNTALLSRHRRGFWERVRTAMQALLTSNDIRVHITRSRLWGKRSDCPHDNPPTIRAASPLIIVITIIITTIIIIIIIIICVSSGHRIKRLDSVQHWSTDSDLMALDIK